MTAAADRTHCGDVTGPCRYPPGICLQSKPRVLKAAAATTRTHLVSVGGERRRIRHHPRPKGPAAVQLREALRLQLEAVARAVPRPYRRIVHRHRGEELPVGLVRRAPRHVRRPVAARRVGEAEGGRVLGAVRARPPGGLVEVVAPGGHRMVPRAPEHLVKGRDGGVEVAVEVARHAGLVVRAPAREAGARGGAHGGAHVGVREARAGAGDPVDVGGAEGELGGRVEGVVDGAPPVVPPLVWEEQQDVGLGRAGGQHWGDGGGSEGQQQPQRQQGSHLQRNTNLEGLSSPKQKRPSERQQKRTFTGMEVGGGWWLAVGGWVSFVADLGFKICQTAKKCPFWGSLGI